METKRYPGFHVKLVITLLLLFLATLAQAATISGTITNNSGKTGRIYLAVQWSGDGNTGFGVSVPNGTTSYAMHGAQLQDGDYSVKAFLDTQNSGMQHANDPVGSANFTMTGDAPIPASVDVILDNPTAVLIQPPTKANVITGSGVVLVTWDTANDTNGNEIDTSYKVYWSTSSDPGPGKVGVSSSPALSGGDNKGFIKALPNNSAPLYFAVTATLGGVESATVNANGGSSITVGAPPVSGVAVSGTVTVPASGVGKPLYVALGGNNGPPAYIARIAATLASQPYSIAGVAPGDYGIYAIVDMNNDGAIGTGDIANTDNNGVPLTVAGTPVSGANVQLVAANAKITVRTSHWQQNAIEGYGLNLQVRTQLKRPVNVAVSGPQLATPIDIGISDRGSFNVWPTLTGRPNLADSYQFAIEYSDGTTTGSSPLTAPITAIIDSFAAPVSPVGFIPYPFSSGDFSWNAPAAPPSPYTYSFWLNNVPDFNSDQYNNMPSGTTLVNIPYAFVDGNNYDWQITVVDSLGNSAQSQVTFTPTTSPAINSFTPASGAPGTQVTITGINFDAATKSNNHVQFSGAPGAATVVSATATQLVVIVPVGASSGPLQIAGSPPGPSNNFFTVISDVTPPTTVATPGGGLYPKPGVDVTLTASEPATIYYTTNGSDPTNSPTFFTDSVGGVAQGPIHITQNTILKYFAVDLSHNSEAIKEQVYRVGTLTTLSLDLGGVSSIVVGNSVNATASITSGAGPTGTVLFFVDGNPYGAPVALSGTTANISISGLQPTGSPHSITASYSGDTTYASSSSNAMPLTVTKLGQSINVTVPAPPSATYNTGFSVAATASSGLPVTYSSSGACTNVGANFTMTSGTGTCVVQYDQPGDATRSPASQITNNTAAQKVNQAITINTHAPGSALYNTGFPVAATSNSGLAVTYSSTGACTNVGANFTMTSGTGTCTVQYDQAGDPNYNPAPQKTENTTAAKADQTITFGALPVKAYGDAPFNPGGTASSGLAVSYSSDTPAVATASGSIVTILSVGTATITASQAGNGNYNAASDVQQTLTVKQPIKFSTPLTSVTAVPVTLEYAGAAKMQFLIDKAAAWTPLVSFAASYPIILPSGNGIKTVSVRFVDAQGKASSIFSANIFLDAAAPVGTIAINGGAASTAVTDLTLNLTASSDSGGPLQMHFSENGTTWTPWVPFAATSSYTLGTSPAAPATVGLKKVYVQFMDSGNKVSKSYFDTINYVAAAAAGGTNSSITINSGGPFTTTTAVKLTLVAPGGENYVRLSSDGVKWGAWVTITPSMPWNLASGDGIKTVYAQYSSDKVTPSATYSASITLDTIAPVGWLLINNGAAVTGSRTVNLTMDATDVNGVASMCAKGTAVACTAGEFIPFASSINNFVITSPGDGVKTVYIQFQDNAGKTSAFFKGSITLDTTAPTGSVKINGGKLTTSIPTVTLTLAAVKAVYMQISVDGGSTWGQWEGYATSKIVILPGGAGEKTVVVKFKDFAGNVLATGFPSASITLLP